ncbi:MAG: Fic family protein [Halieaceae bacterium]
MKNAGYTFLRHELGLLVPPLGMDLAVGDSYDDRVVSYGQGKLKLLAKTKKVGKTPSEHIETAIKYQGIRLAYLSPTFQAINVDELTAYIKAKPTSEIRRCIWYLFEWLTGEELDLPNSKSAYTPLLDDEYYYTLSEGERHSRTRVINNMIGNREFCPVVRKTPEVVSWARKDLVKVAIKQLRGLNKYVNTEILGRSVSYLYTKETKSSTEIEREDAREEKTKKFFRVLKSSGTLPIDKARLIFVQNQIVQSAKKDSDYRKEEIYVGVTRMTSAGVDEDIHYIGPKWEQVPSMMSGLIDMHHALMLDAKVPSMIHAAIVSFGLVYIHPFSDGNGRTHRYLIHDVLKARRPEGEDFIIPVSAAILRRQKDYDRVLETLSRPLMAMLDYDLLEHDDCRVEINNDLHYLYRYPDLTPHVEFLYEMMRAAMDVDLMDEVLFILKFDALKGQINSSFDIPNTKLDLMVRLLLSNDGRVSNRKKRIFNQFLADEEIPALEDMAVEQIAVYDQMAQEINDAMAKD